MTTLPCSVPHLRCRVPGRPGATIRRARLLDALNDAVAQPGTVTLLTAPAGSGKTTLLVDWLTDSRTSVAWLSVDETDNSLASLRQCIASALMQSGSTAVADAVADLPAPGEPGYENYSALLFAALESVDEPVLMVLDDAHLLHDSDVLVALGNFLHWPPPNVHTVIAGRFEPPLALQKLRLDGRVRDVTTDDMAFTRAEADTMFAESGILLSSSAFDAVIARTQGWAAGLRMAAMTLADHPDPGSAVEKFTGSQHSVADYLVSEVLAGLTPDVRRFLVETSVPAWFTVDLAEQLTGVRDARGTLDMLLARNFLIEQTPGPELTYRYHPLMREYLRAEMYRLGAAQVRNLETVASQWFTDSRQPLNALEHSTHSGDGPAIVATLTASGLDLVLEGHSDAILGALEHSPRTVSDSTYGRLLGAAAHLTNGNTAPAISTLTALRRRASEDPESELLRRVLEVQAAMQTGNIRAALEHLEILDIGQADSPGLDAFTLATAGIARLYLGRTTEARRLLVDATSHARAGRLHRTALMCMTATTAANLLDGHLDDALHGSRAAVDYARSNAIGDTEIADAALSLAAVVAHLRMDAVSHSTTLWASIGFASEPVVADYGRRTASALHTRTDARGVPRIGREWIEYERPVIPGLEALLAPVVQQKYFAAGESLWAAELVGVTSRRLGRTGEVSLLAADVHRRAGRLDAAESELTPVVDGTRHCASPVTSIRALLAASSIAHTRRNPTKAYELAVRALTLAEPERILRPFAEAGQNVRDVLTRNHGRFGRLESFADEARAAIPAGRADTAPRSSTSLTPRELELLRELPSWRTAEQIASDHFVSVNTIKTHLRGIYRKLEVRSRRDAIAAAHELGLL
ncbi:LuxR C-terminal-related transcriptional regulator [Rhodococcoides kyotonense]|uniref:LuxR family transcriptional regulator, maltose regulon positive regulatory protein n=1 Tax=Rhodococcoides kyotonense TaxID=398843 RepID=A0A239F718_9NOCA|nr:LuxR C-terminal-related transcriptional regulator [Rhodococcus kyotonensis]SNS51962.1 LuxR family transcriptional regulator, maltose regulon positive regulatory protein [Rhodococcus kyotonensis]